MNNSSRRPPKVLGKTKGEWIYIFMNSHSHESDTNIEDKPLFWSAILSMIAIAIYTETSNILAQGISVVVLLITGFVFGSFLYIQLWCCDTIVESDNWQWNGRIYRGLLGKVRFILNHLGVLFDCIVVLPLPFLLVGKVEEVETLLIISVALRSTKILHYNEVMEHSWGAIKRAWPKLQKTLQFTLCASFIMSTGIYMLERYVQPENLGSVPRAIYFVLVTISTVGYGDISPATAAGRVFTIVFIIGLGLTIFGMVIGAMAESITEGTQEEVNQLEQEVSSLRTALDAQTQMLQEQTEMISLLLESNQTSD